MKSSLFHKISRYTLNLISVLFLVIPYFENYIPLEYDAYWKTNYFWNSTEVVIFISPFLILWVCIQFNFFPKAQKIFTYLMYFIGIIYLFYFSICVAFIAQDFSPTYGIVLMVFVLPIFVVYQRTRLRSE